jgi:hypothetical protein
VCSLIGRGLEHARPPAIPKRKAPEPAKASIFRPDGNAWMGN